MRKAISFFVIVFVAAMLVAQTSPQQGSRFAICIGINEYNSKSLSVLKYARDDAKAVSQSLSAPGGFDKVILMTDDLDRRDSNFPTRENILSRLAYLAKVATPQDSILVFFSGHGIQDAKNMPYVLPLDAEINSSGEILADTAILIYNLTKDIKASGIKKTVLLVDACRDSISANGTGFSMKGLQPGFTGFSSTLYSTQAGLRSFEDPKGKNGIFTRFIVQGLAGAADANGDGIVVLGELYNYEKKQVGLYALDIGKEQLPTDFTSDPSINSLALSSVAGQATLASASAQASLTPMPLITSMVKLVGGRFWMGSSGSERNREPDEILHNVTISGFSIGQYCVTLSQFRAYANATRYKTDAEKNGNGRIWNGSKWEERADASWKNPYIEQSDNDPVVLVSWNDAVAYCNWLSKQEGLTPCYTITGANVYCSWQANGYRLPTEAEWEYACRAKTETATSFGDSLSSTQANFDGNYPYNGAEKGPYQEKTSAVGSYKPNAFGLYDMHGNVRQWCWDWYDDYPVISKDDPKGAASGKNRVLRGGSWIDDGKSQRSAYRDYYGPSNMSHCIGFRVVRSQ